MEKKKSFVYNVHSVSHADMSTKTTTFIFCFVLFISLTKSMANKLI